MSSNSPLDGVVSSNTQNSPSVNITQHGDPIVSVITSHNSRIQCFVAAIFKKLKKICEKHKTQLSAVDTYNSQLNKRKQIRFKNCAILELIVATPAVFVGVVQPLLIAFT